MPVEIKVPSVGESITEVVVSAWLKNVGDVVRRDEVVAELETDKATVEVNSPSAGVLSKQLKQTGDSAQVGETIAMLEEGEAAASAGGEQQATQKSAVEDEAQAAKTSAKQSASARAASTNGAPAEAPRKQPERVGKAAAEEAPVMPSARRVMAEQGIDPSEIKGSGVGGRVLKEDVQKAGGRAGQESVPVQPKSESAAGQARSPVTPSGEDHSALEEIVPLSPIRKKIAERLVESQHTAALLTTFNEIDMSEVVALRKEHQEDFQGKYGIKLGFMSFFVKAVVDALKLFPMVNSEIRWPNVVYKNYYDIGIAIGGGKGLVVPVIRGADRLSFAEIEQVIGDFATRAQANKIDLSELQGGTFTISNGGVYGSLLATPIVNPPQVAILGLHAIQERPVAREGQVVIRPMMYVALTYDHRIVDGRESVTFLKRIKEDIEDPARMLVEI